VRLSAAQRPVAKRATEMAARAAPAPGLVVAAGKQSEVEPARELERSALEPDERRVPPVPELQQRAAGPEWSVLERVLLV
jgi:hypothetical protein